MKRYLQLIGVATLAIPVMALSGCYTRSDEGGFYGGGGTPHHVHSYDYDDGGFFGGGGTPSRHISGGFSGGGGTPAGHSGSGGFYG